MEAFSDGVIAVIITIMVLELHVPRGNGWAGFWSVVPQIAIYVMSFAIIGIYWINHHDLVGRVKSVDYPILWANLIFLLTVSLIPYTVDYLGLKDFDTFSTVLYDALLLLSGAAFFLLRRGIMRRQRELGVLGCADVSELWKHLACLALYLAAIAIAFYRTWLSLLVSGLVTLVWIIPGIMLHWREGDAAPIENERATADRESQKAS
jgi:uncharacterized membrane protein